MSTNGRTQPNDQPGARPRPCPRAHARAAGRRPPARGHHGLGLNDLAVLLELKSAPVADAAARRARPPAGGDDVRNRPAARSARADRPRHARVEPERCPPRARRAHATWGRARGGGKRDGERGRRRRARPALVGGGAGRSGTASPSRRCGIGERAWGQAMPAPTRVVPRGSTRARSAELLHAALIPLPDSCSTFLRYSSSFLSCSFVLPLASAFSASSNFLQRSFSRPPFFVTSFIVRAQRLS